MIQELINLVRHHRKQFLPYFVGFFFFFLFLLGVAGTQFRSHATFKHDGQKEESTFSAEALIKSLASFEPNNDAKPFFYSRTILVPVIKELGMQVKTYERNRLALALLRVKDAIGAEFRFYLDEPDLFTFNHVTYDGIRPKVVYIRFSDHQNYELYNDRKQPIAKSKLDRPLETPTLSWTLKTVPSHLKTHRFYRIKLLPMWKTLDKVQSKFKITFFKSKKKILSLYYSDRSRHKADQFLNTVMSSFQDYLKRENKELASRQLSYLEERQNYLVSQFNSNLGNYVSYLKDNWGTQGFVGTELELDHLAHTKRSYQAKLLDFDLELKRFVKAQSRNLPKNPISPIGFQGIDPSVTKHLYLSYNEQLDRVLHQVQQLSFVINAMQDTQFELSTLKHVINDSYSTQMMDKIAELSFQLRDETNWSTKEHDRIKEQLKHQKEQLIAHISQQIELLKMQSQLIEDKIALLQTSSLDLLENEKELVEGKLLDLSQSLKDLPEKWRLEQQLKFKTALAEAMMRGVSEVVEGKRIEHELKFVHSKPLDSPFCKAKPQFAFLLFKSLICATLFTYLYALYALSKAAKKPFSFSLSLSRNSI